MFTYYNLSHAFWGVNREPGRERGKEGRKNGRDRRREREVKKVGMEEG